MANYIIAYHGGKKPASPEEGKAGMAKWQVWLEDLGEAVVNPGTPLGKSRIVSASGVSPDGGKNPMSGYSIVEADSIDSALEMASQCPFLETGGTLEVAEILKM
jgi:hypothetical protein